MTPQEFISTLSGAAIECMKSSGIPASFTIAQAALESGWGTSQLSMVAFNLFGVKADLSWNGDTYTMRTREFQDGNWIVVPAKWRKYPSWNECLADHADFLKKNKRYAVAFTTKNGNEFCDAIAKSGYATDPAYAQKLKSIISKYNLTQFDKG